MPRSLIKNINGFSFQFPIFQNAISTFLNNRNPKYLIMKTSKITLAILVILLFVFTKGLSAQGRLEDYKRADSLQNFVKDKVINTNIGNSWIGETDKLVYTLESKDKKEFFVVDAEKATKMLAFDHEKLAAALSAETGNKYAANKLPFDKLTFTKDENKIEFVIDDYKWTCDLETYECKKGDKYDPRSRFANQDRNQNDDKPIISPDKKWEAYIQNFNLYVRSKEKDGTEYELSYDGSEGNYYSLASIKWSPDSEKLICNRIIPGYQRLVHYIESSPKDQLQPKHSTRNYTKPGDVLDIVAPVLFQINTKKQINISNTLFPNTFSEYRGINPEWRKDSQSFTFEYNQRGHQVYRVLEVDASTGIVRTLIEELSETFIDYSDKTYRYDIDDGKEIIWASERDGWNHLYLYDGGSGKVKNQITKGEWVVRGVEKVDEQNRQIIFRASGKESGQDPYLINYYLINFDGTGLVKLTNGNANHSLDFSSNRKYFVDTYSRVDLPPVSILCNASDGKEIMQLAQADISDLLKTGWKMPEVFVSKGRDGKTDIWGIICRPMNFDKNKKYPVLEYIYAGPHSAFVPKTFSAYRSMQAYAELGFIVVQIDGMGTNWRSKAFHDVCWKNLKDAGFPDRILWHKAAAKKYPFMDITKVGIYGTSAGGQNSMGAVLFHPEFYDVAVSACGCHDNRMDKIWWNEAWMGWPIGSEYAECSNVVNASKLKGKLFLIVGEMDTNVDPSSTMQVVDALIKAKKDFDLLVVPGMGHSSGGIVGERKTKDFFVKNLLGVNPPNWNSIEN